MLGIRLEAERKIRTDTSRCSKQGLELRFVCHRKLRVLNSYWSENEVEYMN